jgi:hypothetical protein
MRPIVCASFCVLFLSASATTSSRAGSPGSAGNPINESSKTVHISSFSLIREDFASTAKDYFSNAYTRLLVTSPVDRLGSTETVVDFPYQKRLWLSRFLVGRHSSTGLSIKVSVGSFTTTVPIATVDHISTAGDGESFTRIVYHRAEDFPLFLVKRDGTSDVVSIHSSVRVSDQLQSGAAGAALSVTQSAIRLVAPQAAVLTALSAQNAKDKASALDSAINKLFATSVDEEQWADGHLLFWGAGASITFAIPYPEGNLAKPIRIGTWTVAFESPRPSIFSDVFICESAEQKNSKKRCDLTFDKAAALAEAEVNGADVFAFKLTEGASELGTVDAYVKKQDWYLTGVKAFSGTPRDSDVLAFCSSARTAIAGLDLNSVDQGIIAHALVSTLATTADAKRLVAGEPRCKCDFGNCKV